jgi:hypothetical protein
VDIDTPTLSLCEKETHTGSLVRIASHPNVHINLTKDLHCHCKISVENNVQIQFERVAFKVVPPTESECDHKVVLSTGGDDDAGICQRIWTRQNDGVHTSCYGDDKDWTVAYDNNGDTERAAGFIIEAKGRISLLNRNVATQREFLFPVHPEETIVVECGLVATADGGLEMANPAAASNTNGDSITSNISTQKSPLI